MINSIAERQLLYTAKGNDKRQNLIIRIGRPYLVKEDSVNFSVTEGTAGCSVEFDGLPQELTNEVYGADLLQALQLAVNIEPILKTLSKKYNFYFPDGEPYFGEK